MKQVWMSAMFLVCVGTAAAFADDSAVSPAAAAGPARREAFHVAFEACLSENNLTRPERGVRSSEADRQVIDACLSAKGFNHPPEPPPDRQSASDTSSADAQ